MRCIISEPSEWERPGEGSIGHVVSFAHQKSVCLCCCTRPDHLIMNDAMLCYAIVMVRLHEDTRSSAPFFLLITNNECCVCFSISINLLPDSRICIDIPEVCSPYMNMNMNMKKATLCNRPDSCIVSYRFLVDQNWLAGWGGWGGGGVGCLKWESTVLTHSAGGRGGGGDGFLF